MDWELCLHSLQYNTSLYIQWTDSNTVLVSKYMLWINTVIPVDFKSVEKRPPTAHPNLNQIMIFVNYTVCIKIIRIQIWREITQNIFDKFGWFLHHC